MAEDATYNNYLDGLQADLQAIIDNVMTEFSGLDDIQFNWKPNATSWSVAQCLEHVRAAGLAFIPEFETKLSSFQGGADPNIVYRPGFFAKRFIHFIGPNTTIRVSTSKKLEPELSNYTVDSLEDFIDFQNKLMSVVDEARKVDPYKVKIQSPVASIFKLGVGDMLKFMIEHEFRHIKQAKDVVQNPSFPEGRGI